jgi:hypothetical protein
LLQRLALAISSLGHGTVDEPNHLLGEIALLANDYVTGSALRQVEKQDKVDYVTLMIEMLPTWDITNGPDLAYGLTRAYRILQVHPPGDDAVVVELRNKLTLDFSNAMFDGLAIDDSVGCIFGMYSWYETLEAQKLVDGTVNCVIDTAAFLGKPHFPKAHLWDRRRSSLTTAQKILSVRRGLRYITVGISDGQKEYPWFDRSRHDNEQWMDPAGRGCDGVVVSARVYSRTGC